MARLGIYPQCEVGDHQRMVMDQIEMRDVPKGGGWSSRSASGVYTVDRFVRYDGCARMACTCTCHAIEIRWSDTRGWRGTRNHMDLSRQADAIKREIYGFLEDA
jgi:hypothetical protein